MTKIKSLFISLLLTLGVSSAIAGSKSGMVLLPKVCDTTFLINSVY